jgi:serine kinase of HPr protein (carbohydrate metabolism regulator)
MTTEPGEYIHANALALGEKGLLLRGPSGSGKSVLTLSLIAHFSARGDFARLVADDRTRIEAVGGRLVARPHPAIAGRIEIRGLGPTRLAHEPACVLAAVVDLRACDDPPPRLPDACEKQAILRGVALPRLFAIGRSDSAVAKIAVFIQSIETN